MKTIEEKAEEALKSPWIRWVDRKPEENELIIVIEIVRDWQGYHILHMGDAKIGIIERLTTFGFESLYWLPLPQAERKEEEK